MEQLLNFNFEAAIIERCMMTEHHLLLLAKYASMLELERSAMYVSIYYICVAVWGWCLHCNQWATWQYWGHNYSRGRSASCKAMRLQRTKSSSAACHCIVQYQLLTPHGICTPYRHALQTMHIRFLQVAFCPFNALQECYMLCPLRWQSATGRLDLQGLSWEFSMRYTHACFRNAWLKHLFQSGDHISKYCRVAFYAGQILELSAWVAVYGLCEDILSRLGSMMLKDINMFMLLVFMDSLTACMCKQSVLEQSIVLMSCPLNSVKPAFHQRWIVESYSQPIVVLFNKQFHILGIYWHPYQVLKCKKVKQGHFGISASLREKKLFRLRFVGAKRLLSNSHPV